MALQMPRRNQPGVKELLPLIGAAGGALIAGLPTGGAGAAAGATAGAGAAGGAGAIGAGAMQGFGAGSAAGSLLGLAENKKGALQQSGGNELAAMARKQAQASQDTLGSLKQAEAALPQLPEGLRQAYAEPIIKARMLAERERGIA